MDPQSALAHADTLFRQGRTEDAVFFYRAIVPFRAGDRRLHGNLANALSSQGRQAEALEVYEEALPFFQHVLDRAPGHLSALINLENALCDLGRRAEARAIAGRALDAARGQGGEPHTARVSERLGSLRSLPQDAP